MTQLSFANTSADARPLHVIDTSGLAQWLETLEAPARTWAEATGFGAGAGEVLVIPGSDGRPTAAAVGLGGAADARRRRFTVAAARAALPDGVWRLVTDLGPEARDEAALGWLLAGYRFGRYKTASPAKAALLAPEGCDAPRLEAIASGEALTRDLINTPAADMGPGEIEDAARALGEAHGAVVTVIAGEALLEHNFPLIHTVGRAHPRAPRLIELRHGTAGPRLTLVGKGVSFDTGGLNLKPGGSMALMKKDMGGAANVLGLASMIIATGLPCQLRVLIPAVENSVAGNAFRPGDVLTSRKGLTVEINNTDAEGRLILADALAYATEEDSDLLVSMATLTGAARVAVGPDLAPYYTDDDAVADALNGAAARVRDPVWRLPFWDPYEPMIEPGVADLDNAPAGGMAGSITAALFLRRFAGAARYIHFDIYGWNPKPAPARPKGGAAQGIRALLEAVPEVLG